MRLDEAADLLMELEGAYAQSWTSEATEWLRLGLYRKIASLVDLREGGIHTDIGSGWGHLLSALQKKSVKEGVPVHFFGMERSSVLAYYSLSALRNEGIHAGLHMNSHLEVVQNAQRKDCVRHRFLYDREEAKKLKLLDKQELGNVHIIQCDIRDEVEQHGILRQILRHRKLSSASFTFPGTSTNAVIEYPYPYEHLQSEAQIAERMREVLQATRASAYRFATEHVRPGGQFVIADRMADKNVTGLERMQSIVRRVADVFGPLREYWDLRDVVITRDNAADIQTHMGWTTQLEGKEVEKEELKERGWTFAASVLRLIRRRKRFRR